MSSSPRKGSPKKPSPPKRDLQIFYGSLHDIFSYRKSSFFRSFSPSLTCSGL